jgi:NADH-quinone oxidoreductase subunit E
MAWPTIDRNKPAVEKDAAPLLTDGVKAKIESFFDRYETKRAALLPALHITQEALGYISWQAIEEVAALLDLPASDVFDVVTFYTHYWTRPRGKKEIVVCCSLSCELMGANELLEALQKHLGIGLGETTPDGAYSLRTEECLAMCDHAPCVLINEKKHRCIKPEDVPALLADPDNDRLDIPRSDLYDPVPPTRADARAAATETTDKEGDDTESN